MSKITGCAAEQEISDQREIFENDPLRRVVHVILAVYLLPAFALVMVVGGTLVLVTGAARIGGQAVGALGMAYRRGATAEWTKRVKPPVADSFSKSRTVQQHRNPASRG